MLPIHTRCISTTWLKRECSIFILKYLILDYLFIYFPVFTDCAWAMWNMIFQYLAKCLLSHFFCKFTISNFKNLQLLCIVHRVFILTIWFRLNLSALPLSGAHSLHPNSVGFHTGRKPDWVDNSLAMQPTVHLMVNGPKLSVSPLTTQHPLTHPYHSWLQLAFSRQQKKGTFRSNDVNQIL